MYLPSIIEREGRSHKAFDLPTKLLDDRIIYMGVEFDEYSSTAVIMQLMWLASDKPGEDIYLYINSPGGSVYDGLAIKDVMDRILITHNCKVNIIAVGCIASMGAYLTSAATGTRKATKNCRIMIHSVSSGAAGTYHDMKISMKETEYLQQKLMIHIANNSKGKSSLEDIEKMCERDYWMDPDEAIKIGLIDGVL